MKKALGIYIIMVCIVVTLSGCAGGSYEGKNLVDKAKTLHTELEAANIVVYDYSGRAPDEGAAVQEISYRFAGDVMQYMYLGRDAKPGEEYYASNNGTELDTWHTGDTGWSAVAKGNEEFYNYSRIKRHYFADGALLLNDYASAAKSASVRTENDGASVVKIEYDDSKIAQYDQMQGVTGYRQEYWLDVAGTDGCTLLYVDYLKDGEPYSYRVTINRCGPEEPIKRAEPPALAAKTETVQ